MKQEEPKDFLEPLNHLHHVETPPFLFTRIQQKLALQQDQQLSRPKALALVASFCVLLLLNVVGVAQLTNRTSEEQNLVQQFRLMPDNNLYE